MVTVKLRAGKYNYEKKMNDISFTFITLLFTSLIVLGVCTFLDIL